jgi:hypothetical protein
MKVFELVKENSLFSSHTRSINVGKDPRIIVMHQSELNRHTKFIVEYCSARE